MEFDIDTQKEINIMSYMTSPFETTVACGLGP